MLIHSTRASHYAFILKPITRHPIPRPQSFPGAERIVQNLGATPALVTVPELRERRIVQDDRIEMTMTDGGVFFHIPGK